MKRFICLIYMMTVCFCFALFQVSVSAQNANNDVDFEMKDINGNSTTIKSLSRKSVVLIFGRMG